jgi:hypothetical protein
MSSLSNSDFQYLSGPETASPLIIQPKFGAPADEARDEIHSVASSAPNIGTSAESELHHASSQ